ncbi:hypothetical protein L1987_33317 [Smallanthus sonchifolius]|uniref:Uncharacterized protein n=1 Tax=Smallanthus sonchifolius TaxID=185202 RepID=A0ACB9HSE4_9ASTR|nr:hypothetical protein L1987_33317 [Smallanthus sonchifolius]
MFTVIGCDDYALINDTNGFTSGCFALCQKEPNVPYGQCSGNGCCQISIPKGLSYYNSRLYTLQKHIDVWFFNECGYGFLVEEGSYEFNSASDLNTSHDDFINKIESTMPIVVDWVIKSNGTCTAEVNECKGNSLCYDVEGSGGYRCKCINGYEGNPYLHPGCQELTVQFNPKGVVTAKVGSNSWLVVTNSELTMVPTTVVLATYSEDGSVATEAEHLLLGQ